MVTFRNKINISCEKETNVVYHPCEFMGRLLFMAKLFDSPQMRETLRRLIRSRMAYKGFEYKDLCRALKELGVHQAESNLRSKVNNGALGAQLLMYILMAMDMQALDLNQVREILSEVTEQQKQVEPQKEADEGAV